METKRGGTVQRKSNNDGWKSAINGLWYVPITKISEDNPDQSNDSEDNPEQQIHETATQATQSQVRLQSTNTQGLSTTAHEDPVEVNRIAT